MKADEEAAHDFCSELLRNKSVCESTYERAVAMFGEHGVIDILGVAGYFITVSMVMNVARTPAPVDANVGRLQPFPF